MHFTSSGFPFCTDQVAQERVFHRSVRVHARVKIYTRSFAYIHSWNNYFGVFSNGQNMLILVKISAFVEQYVYLFFSDSLQTWLVRCKARITTLSLATSPLLCSWDGKRWKYDRYEVRAIFLRLSKSITNCLWCITMKDGSANPPMVHVIPTKFHKSQWFFELRL